uniref:RNA replicase n=1 Tax=Beihai noda-like virus 17 TaxID=1922470 RepID=A0A1L3KFH0_9VIRU|nr:hypothetical protein [Beihai noda-like virus 17]
MTLTQDLSEWIVYEYGDSVGQTTNSGIRREIQRNINLANSVVRKGHPHKQSAQQRNGATQGMVNMIRAMGFEPYHISPSKREADQQGCRKYYHLRDLDTKRKNHKITERHILVMTDVDYYADLYYWLSFKRPIILYTFVPRIVSGKVDDDSMFTIIENEVHYSVNGGSTWQHPVWDYNDDFLYVPKTPTNVGQRIIKWFLGLFGYDLGAVVIVVDQYKVSDHRRFVSLVPTKVLPWYVKAERYGKQLTRMNYKHGNMNAVVVLDSKEPYISIAPEGNHTSVEVPLNVFEPARTAHNLGKDNYLSSTERRVKEGIKSAYVHQFLAENTKSKVTIVHEPGEMATHYVAIRDTAETLDEPHKTYARRFANCPIGDAEAIYPTEQFQNDMSCVEERVLKPAKEAQARISKQPQERFNKYAQEYVDLIVPASKVGTGVPLTIEEVAELQNKPRQKQRSEQNRFNIDHHFMVKAFQKREAYSTANAPRNISSVPVTHTLRLGSFSYAAKHDLLDELPWFMPGKSPQEIADAVHGLKEFDSVYMTDYSRFDGTVTHWIRQNVEFAVYLRWVKPEHRAELSKLLNDEIHTKAFTKFGVKYLPDGSRLSGSSITTDGNTIDNGFVDFAALREVGYTPEESFAKIGLKYGDDGLTPNHVSKDVLERTSKFCGFSLKLQQANKTDEFPYVTFLSRYFPNLWHTNSSFQDPVRALAKINTTVDTTSDVEQCGWNKTSGYLVTDPKTPVLAEWCKCYQRNVKNKARVMDKESKDLPYWIRDPNLSVNPWQQTSKDEMVGLIEHLTGIDVADYEGKLAMYTGDVMNMPVFNLKQPAAKIDAQLIGAGKLVDRIVSASETKVDNGSDGKQNNQRSKTRNNGSQDRYISDDKRTKRTRQPHSPSNHRLGGDDTKSYESIKRRVDRRSKGNAGETREVAGGPRGKAGGTRRINPKSGELSTLIARAVHDSSGSANRTNGQDGAVSSQKQPDTSIPSALGGIVGVQRDRGQDGRGKSDTSEGHIRETPKKRSRKRRRGTGVTTPGLKGVAGDGTVGKTDDTKVDPTVAHTIDEAASPAASNQTLVEVQTGGSTRDEASASNPQD